MLDTHLDLLSRDKYTDISSKYFFCLHNIFKRSSRHVSDISSKYFVCLHNIFKRSSRHVFTTCLQDIFRSCLQDVFKTPLRPTIVCWAITYKLKFIDSCRFMNTSLENLVDNLSEINNKDYKKCIERNKIKSGCKLTKLKDNRLIYKCKKCNDISYKPILDLIDIDFAIKISINLFYY